METYKNSYSVKEDQVLWELHEIRHELHEELKSRPLAEFNKGAREFFEQWKKPYAGRTRTNRGRKHSSQETSLHVKAPFQP
jgi:hypothetical protein